MKELYPGKNFFKVDDKEVVGLVNIESITFGAIIQFLPYDLKITENLTPEWNQETVIGRMDPIARFKRMGRTMNINFKARVKEKIGNPPYMTYDDLLHSVDHLKKLLYPRYNSSQVMTSPPLFRIKCENLILAGETETLEKGVLCYITSLKADPVMDKNTVLYIGANGQQTYRQAVSDKLSREPAVNEPKFGNLETAMYPKSFDINIGFTVLNENLTSYQVAGTLNRTYFYNFKTERGPAGGHPLGHQIPDNEAIGGNPKPYEVNYTYVNNDGNTVNGTQQYNSKREAIDIANNSTADSKQEQALFDTILGGD